MTIDVSQFLPPDDSPNAGVEHLVSLPKYTVPGSTSYLHGFRPPRNMDIPVRTNGHHLLNLTGYMNTIGFVYLDLQHDRQNLRKPHTHPDHYNPDGEAIGNPHMHFPFIKLPIAETGHSYAYELDYPDPDFDDINEAVEAFCAEMGISIETFQPYLAPSGRGE